MRNPKIPRGVVTQRGHCLTFEETITKMKMEIQLRGSNACLPRLFPEIRTYFNANKFEFGHKSQVGLLSLEIRNL